MAAQIEANPADWKSYEELAYGIDTNRLPQTDALEGTGFRIRAGEQTISLEFGDRRVAWQETGGARGADPYDAVEVAGDTFFVDLWRRSHAEREALTLIVNRTTGRTLSILTTVRERDVSGEPRVAQAFAAGVLLDRDPPAGEAPEETRDLLGKRIFNDYSPSHFYEHIYVNSQRYCWQCLRGVQQGHGDCDLASYWRFAEGQYVFAFREFRIPVASVLFFDFDTMRSTGKFLGVESDGRIRNGAAGAHIQVLSETRYPDGVQPV